MRSIPIDIAAFLGNVVSPVGFDPVVDYQTGEQRRNTDGLLRWRLTVLYQEPGRKKELVEIGFAGTNPPEATPGAELIVQGLVGRHWENTNEYGTSSGVSLSADSIAFKPAAGIQPAKPKAA